MSYQLQAMSYPLSTLHLKLLPVFRFRMSPCVASLGWHDDDFPVLALTAAFGNQFLVFLQGQVNDTSVMCVHVTEGQRFLCFFNFFADSFCHAEQGFFSSLTVLLRVHNNHFALGVGLVDGLVQYVLKGVQILPAAPD